jgi:hypothetical protein
MHAGIPSAISNLRASVAEKPPTSNSRFPWYAPRMWSGMTAGVWLKLLASNRFAVSPSRWPMAAVVSSFCLMNSCGRLLSEAFYRRAAERVSLQPPLFVIGHWRCGTTLLHELLVLDEQYSFPTTMQCTIPHDFLMFEGLANAVFGPLVPKQRAMDNMEFGPKRPQEDEIALCNLGAPSPYRCWAFPDRSTVPEEHLDLEGLKPRDVERWKRSLMFLLKRLAVRDPRRIVLKSPTHTARIRTLLELFPEAQFVHITRDPFVVFQSTLRTWHSISEVLRFSRIDKAVIEEQVLSNFVRLYRAFFRDRGLLDPGQFHQVRYEDLIENPTQTVQSIYERLALGDFEPVRPKLEAFFAERKDYRRKQYEFDPELRRKLVDRWGELIEALGYPLEPQAEPQFGMDTTVLAQFGRNP